MSSVFQRPAQVDLQKSYEFWSQDDSAPTVSAKLVSPTVAMYRCPHCMGLHRANVTCDGGGLATRETDCPPEFRIGTGHLVNLRITGKAPREWQLVFDKDVPTGDLIVAYRLANGGGASTSAARLARSDDDSAWSPSKDDLRVIFRTMARCGFMDEAQALRLELGQLAPAAAWRGAAADIWRTGEGGRWLQRLRSQIRCAWAQVGIGGDDSDAW